MTPKIPIGHKTESVIETYTGIAYYNRKISIKISSQKSLLLLTENMQYDIMSNVAVVILELLIIAG